MLKELRFLSESSRKVLILICSHQNAWFACFSYYAQLQHIAAPKNGLQNWFSSSAHYRHFSVENDWCHSIPTRSSLARSYLTYSQPRQQLQYDLMASNIGDILCGDHTFKVAKVIILHINCQAFYSLPQSSAVDGGKIYEALFSIMNEMNIVIAFFLTQTKSLSEFVPKLKAVTFICDSILNISSIWT
jgi:hypothetical protein